MGKLFIFFAFVPREPETHIWKITIRSVLYRSQALSYLIYVCLMCAVSIYYSIQIAAKLSFSSFVRLQPSFPHGRGCSTWDIERSVFEKKGGKSVVKSIRTLCFVIYQLL